MKRTAAFLMAAMLLGALLSPVHAADDEAQEAADRLHALGLFQGSGTNEDGTPIYDLDRAPTRNEAVTMLVRLLGKEEEAKAGQWDIPFTDVANWAVPYVGYAYANGLTNGTGETTFGGDSVISATQYLTLVLRALGYSSETDFRWDRAWELSDSIGLTGGEYDEAHNTLLRGGVAIISADALEQEVQGASASLLECLVRSGAVSAESAEEEIPEIPPVVHQTGDIVTIGAEPGPYSWKVESKTLLRAFPDAAWYTTRMVYQELEEATGVSGYTQAIRSAVFAFHNGETMVDVRKTPVFGFSLPPIMKIVLFDENGSILAYTEDTMTDPEAKTISFKVLNMDTAPLWEEISARVEEAVENCRRNTVTIDLDHILKTEADGDVWCPVYLNGVDLADLPNQYLLNGIVLNADRGAALEAAPGEFLKIARQTIFRVLYEPLTVNYGNGWELYDMWVTSQRLESTEAVKLLFLQDENRNIIGCLPINLNVDSHLN